MAEFGTFSVPQDLDLLEFDFDDSGDEVLLSLVASDYVPLPASDSVKKIDPELHEAALDLPPPETPTQPSVSPAPSRFRKVSQDDLKKYEESHQSKATKMNTRWGMKIFQGTCIYLCMF